MKVNDYVRFVKPLKVGPRVAIAAGALRRIIDITHDGEPVVAVQEGDTSHTVVLEHSLFSATCRHFAAEDCADAAQGVPEKDLAWTYWRTLIGAPNCQNLPAGAIVVAQKFHCRLTSGAPEIWWCKRIMPSGVTSQESYVLPLTNPKVMEPVADDDPCWTRELVAACRNPDQKVFAAMEPFQRRALHIQANKTPHLVLKAASEAQASAAGLDFKTLVWEGAGEIRGGIQGRVWRQAYKLSPDLDPMEEYGVDLAVHFADTGRLHVIHPLYGMMMLIGDSQKGCLQAVRDTRYLTARILDSIARTQGNIPVKVRLPRQ